MPRSSSATESSIVLRAGPRARELIAREGLNPTQVSAIPAAAGGPKGLALIPLDRFLFGEWLRPRADGGVRWLVGSSVGAWRMAAAAQEDPVAALERMREGYFGQRYPFKPTPEYVSAECAKTASAALGDAHWRADHRLVVITARSRGLLREGGGAARFAAAALANAASRRQLGRYFERVLFQVEAHAGDEIRACVPPDPCGAEWVALSAANAPAALLASGTIPMLAAPVRSPEGATAGLYWDGGMIDYHLDWHWHRLPGLVLYPHFGERVVPGWLDKHLPWRTARGHHLDNLLLIAPSPALLASLPRGKLPDRTDFHHFGLDHGARVAAWTRALGECERMAEDFARFAADPDPKRLLPLR